MSRSGFVERESAAKIPRRAPRTSSGMPSPATAGGVSLHRDGEPRPADVVARVVRELQDDREDRPARVADRLLEVEDGGVILAELRVDGPGGTVGVGVDGRRDRQAALLERRPRLADLHGHRLPAAERRC